MSGAVAAHAAYNGSGTQGLAVTNKIQDQEGDVMSVFWNKNDTTRQLLHGSTILEVPASGNNGNVNFGGSKIFTINNDIDCLGELYLNMKVTIVNNFNGTDYPAWGGNVDMGAVTASGNRPKFQFKLGALTNIIERIEYQVGTQIWQTLEKDDVRVVYNTEMSEAAYDSVSRRSRPSNKGSEYDTQYATKWGNVPYGPDATDDASEFGPGDDVDVTFIIPALTKTLAPQLETFTNVSESGYPLAAAPHQSIKIKIYLASTDNVSATVPTVDDTGATLSVVAGDSILLNVDDSPYLSSITLTATNVNAGTPTASEKSFGPAPISLKSIKLYAKHLIMCNEERDQMKSMPLGLPKRLKMTQNALITDVSNVLQKTIDLDHFSLYGSHLIISGNLGKDVYIKSAELKLNSSSFSGVLPAQMLDYAAASSLGLYVNRDIESDQTEALDGVGILVFPLGSSGYSGSSVPLNRFDSIRLTLAFTGKPASSSPYISITCIGETTALFKGGAASLAMY
jgi:hypothetical protein